MARARNIKPKFFENEGLAELNPLARLLFIGLWTISDFKGCIEYRPKRIKVQLLPYDDCDTEALMISLDKSGFISIYSVQGQKYVKIINFHKHQNPHKNERDAGSNIPDIDKKDCAIKHLIDIEINRDKDGTNRADSLFLNPDSLFLNPESLFIDSGITSCAEPQSDSTPEKIPEPNFVIEIPLQDKTEFGITESQLAEWVSAYPAVDVMQNLRTMRQWCIANPAKRKTRRGVLAFCNSWLMKEQDRPRQARAGPSLYESARDKSRREASEKLTGRKNGNDIFDVIDIQTGPAHMG